MQRGHAKDELATQPRGKVFPLFVPVLWILGGSASWDDLTPERAALANLLGLIFTALALAAVVVVSIAIW